ncbi:hypothetical protein MAR_016523 [Mya arenaria]|uniref:Uncharacterized protein n=1 Tax=Mya arenaria TaxID=6604 RepID=A0ABY7FNV7_MYAAR|nr:hypothetical protein MAR_016523 [Mya arenaria]
MSGYKYERQLVSGEAEKVRYCPIRYVQSYDDVLQAFSKTDEVEGEQRVDILPILHIVHKKISQSLIEMRLIKEKEEYAQENFKE